MTGVGTLIRVSLSHLVRLKRLSSSRSLFRPADYVADPSRYRYSRWVRLHRGPGPRCDRGVAGEDPDQFDLPLGKNPIAAFNRRLFNHCGLIDANLGEHVVKKRVAFRGRGKRGGIRTLVV